MLLLYALTIFLSAALLFTVQPMIAKMILPLLGGSPAVWNTCMVFFQMILLAGYAYSHFVPERLGVRRHALGHVALLLLPLIVLPIRIAGWNPPGTDNPVPWLLALLLAAVGLPFFVLSSNAPLLQHWFASTGRRAGRDPYFLYGASNLGSMVALLGYPLVIEPHLRLAAQSRMWMVGYVLLILLVAACAWLLHRSPRSAGVSDVPPPSNPSVGPPGPSELESGPTPSFGQRLRWVALAFVPSSLMLGVTSYITTDVAVVPLLWVIPLALYLLTFIIVFARPPAWLHLGAVILLPLVVVRLAMLKFSPTQPEIGEVILIHLFAFFVAALVCHGELARSRPAPRYLTEFYLWMSVGGMLGGVFNALIAPVVFDRVVEYPLAMVLVFLLRPNFGKTRRPAVVPTDAPAARKGKERRPPSPAASVASSGRRSPWLGVAAYLGWTAFAIVLAVVFYAQSIGGDPRLFLYSGRNFFGVTRVKLGPFPKLVSMFHGTTIHGVQNTDPAKRDEPLAYFHRAGPAGQTFAAVDRAKATRRVAVCGLGIGTLLSYALPGEEWIYYEIDPAVDRLARDTRFFTYVRDAESRGVRVQTVLGDARIRLERAPGRFGLIVLDVFTSDAIPVHLLTREAFRMYLDKLEDDGVILVNISSRYFRLAPVLADVAGDLGVECRFQDYESITPADVESGKVASQWVVMARHPESFGGLDRDPRWQRLTGRPGARVWSDDFSNILSVMIWGG